MKRRQTVFVAIILLLLGANIWHWWPRAGEIPRMETSPAARHFTTEDFALKIPSEGEDRYTQPRRNLFQPKMAIVQTNIKKINNPAPPPKTPEQLDEETARTELSQIKLVGIVFRGDRGQAFLTKGDQVYLAFPGDKVGDRFAVESVTTDTVQLKDSKTNVTGRIPISGNP